MRTLNYLILIPIVTLVLFTQQAKAEEKIATVDMNKIINNLPESKTKKDELDKKSSAFKTEVEKKRKKLSSMETIIREKKLGPDSKEVKDIKKMAKDYQDYVSKNEKILKKEYFDFNKILTDKAQNAIDTYAKSKNIDIIFNKSGNSPGPVLFGKKEHDVTDAIMGSL